MKIMAVKTWQYLEPMCQHVTYLELGDCTITFLAIDAVLASIETFHSIIEFTNKRHRQSPFSDLTHVQPLLVY